MRNFCRSCIVCQRQKPAALPAGLLQPLEKPDRYRRWESISMDFIVRLPETTRGFDAVLTIVDRLSTMVYFLPFRCCYII